MKVKRPALVTVIGDLNILNTFFVIASFFPTPRFIEQLGFSFIPINNISEVIIRILEIISLLIIAHGFLELKKWGYWLMIYYNLFFLVLSMVFLLSHIKLLGIIPGFIQSLLGLIITFPAKRYFFEENDFS